MSSATVWHCSTLLGIKTRERLIALCYKPAVRFPQQLRLQLLQGPRPWRRSIEQMMTLRWRWSSSSNYTHGNVSHLFPVTAAHLRSNYMQFCKLVLVQLITVSQGMGKVATMSAFFSFLKAATANQRKTWLGAQCIRKHAECIPLVSLVQVNFSIFKYKKLPQNGLFKPNLHNRIKIFSILHN